MIISSTKILISEALKLHRKQLSGILLCYLKRWSLFSIHTYTYLRFHLNSTAGGPFLEVCALCREQLIYLSQRRTRRQQCYLVLAELLQLHGNKMLAPLRELKILKPPSVHQVLERQLVFCMCRPGYWCLMLLWTLNALECEPNKQRDTWCILQVCWCISVLLGLWTRDLLQRLCRTSTLITN